VSLRIQNERPAALTRHRKAVHGYIPRAADVPRGKELVLLRAVTGTPSRICATERRNSFLKPANGGGDSTDSGYATAEGLKLFENPHPAWGRRQLSKTIEKCRVLRRTQYSSAASSVAQGTPAARKSADPYFGSIGDAIRRGL